MAQTFSACYISYSLDCFHVDQRLSIGGLEIFRVCYYLKPDDRDKYNTDGVSLSRNSSANPQRSLRYRQYYA